MNRSLPYFEAMELFIDHKRYLVFPADFNLRKIPTVTIVGIALVEQIGFCFINGDIPPTNNLGEQTIRKVVIDRKVTQGTNVRIVLAVAVPFLLLGLLIQAMMFL